MAERITRESLRTRLTGSVRPVLVEALGAAFYADAHLPGAVNIPPGDVDRLASRLLPDAAAEIIVYCTGSCASSVAVARRLEQLGYAAVSIYEGGKEEWVEYGLPVERCDGDDVRC